MQTTCTKIEGLMIIQPQVFGDDRGFFVETYNQDRYQESGVEYAFVQDNLSKSRKGVLRGLHMQKGRAAQGKLVQVIQGSVLDVAVDVRLGSDTYGQYKSIELTGEHKTQFWIPPGFLHGFVTLEDDTIFSYKCTEFYAPEEEIGVMWNDSELDVDWQLEKYGIDEPLISDKDQKNITFQELHLPNL